MSWFLYLIECADDSIYTGITTDVAARFDEHASGKGARYTRSRKPRAVLASFPLPDRSSASRAEYWVKRLTAAQKRELAAGLRTLESVMPVVVAVDASDDAAGVKTGARGRKKSKVENVDSAAKTTETGKSTKKAGKAGKAEKIDKAAKASGSPKATKAAPVAKRKKPDSDAVARKTSSRDTPVKKDKPAAPASSKGKTPAVGGKLVTNGRKDTAPAPARRRAAATQAPEASVATRRAKRTKDAPPAIAPPVSVSARKQTPRTKQNRAAS